MTGRRIVHGSYIALQFSSKIDSLLGEVYEYPERGASEM